MAFEGGIRRDRGIRSDLRRETGEEIHPGKPRDAAREAHRIRVPARGDGLPDVDEGRQARDRCR